MKPTYEELLTVLKGFAYSRHIEYDGDDDPYGRCIYCNKIVTMNVSKHADDCVLMAAEDLIKRINEDNKMQQ